MKKHIQKLSNMKNYYKIKKTNFKQYPYIVFSTCYINPMDQKEDIEKELKKNKVQGKILFDLLLSHGNTPDRFFEAIFDGYEILEDSIKNIVIVPDKIKDIAADFYYIKQEFLENSVLSNTQKFLIRNKTPLKSSTI
ncbi:MAG: type II toxin-antitoxin system RnlB family antitoxin [Desulfatiglans sp.]|nr:type II toxin-antitoxin system RnlB family antitoxin [Desulfatiglans sp.]